MLIKIRYTRLHPLGEKALLTQEGLIHLIGVDLEFFNPEL